jgi:hypothetical protein
LIDFFCLKKLNGLTIKYTIMAQFSSDYKGFLLAYDFLRQQKVAPVSQGNQEAVVAQANQLYEGKVQKEEAAAPAPPEPAPVIPVIFSPKKAKAKK